MHRAAGGIGKTSIEPGHRFGFTSILPSRVSPLASFNRDAFEPLAETIIEPAGPCRFPQTHLHHATDSAKPTTRSKRERSVPLELDANRSGKRRLRRTRARQRDQRLPAAPASPPITVRPNFFESNMRISGNYG